MSSLVSLVQSLLKTNKITIDNEELSFQIQSHPSFPSLHSITGVLSHFNVENIALKVPVDESTLSQLPKSFIAQVNTEKGQDFALVINKGLDYKLIFDNKESKLISLKDFLKDFTGVLVAIEKDENTISEKKSNLKIYTKGLSVLAILLFVTLFFINSPSIIETFHFTLSIIGIGISVLLIQHDLGIQSKIVNSICSQDNKATNCNTVLNSKGAKIFNHLKLSDISFIYFSAISLGWLFISLTGVNSNVIFLLSLAAVPTVGFSIYYQAFVAKSWCLLCLLTASVLSIQAIPFFFWEFSISNIGALSILLISLTSVTTASLWLFSKSKLKTEKEYLELKIEATKFKRNFDLFNTSLEKSETINTNLPNTKEVVFGNKNAPLNLTLITNPFCGFCKEAHNTIEAILKQYHTTVQITIRFNINTSDKTSDAVKVSSRLLELYHTKGEIACLEAMHAIYNNNNANIWLEQWGACNNLDEVIVVLEAEKEWCTTNNINFTPELLINGKAFPKAYDRSDLIFFIEDLHDNCCTNTTENLIHT